MDTTILAVRAVASTFIYSILWPILAIVGGVYAGLFILSWWLADAVNSLWWLLVILASPLFFVALIAWLISFLIAKRLRPYMNRSQQQLAQKITGQISDVAEKVGTPRIFILARIVRDIVTKTGMRDSYIGELAQEPGELRRNFMELRSSFEGLNSKHRPVTRK